MPSHQIAMRWLESQQRYFAFSSCDSFLNARFVLIEFMIQMIEDFAAENVMYALFFKICIEALLQTALTSAVHNCCAQLLGDSNDAKAHERGQRGQRGHDQAQLHRDGAGRDAARRAPPAPHPRRPLAQHQPRRALVRTCHRLAWTCVLSVTRSSAALCAVVGCEGAN